MTDLFNELYNKKLQYNCCYRVMQWRQNSELCLIFLGTSEYIIISNYSGVLAYGSRKYNFDTSELYYTYQITRENYISVSAIEKIITKHEKQDMKLNCIIHFERIKEDER